MLALQGLECNWQQGSNLGGLEVSLWTIRSSSFLHGALASCSLITQSDVATSPIKFFCYVILLPLSSWLKDLIIPRSSQGPQKQAIEFHFFLAILAEQDRAVHNWWSCGWGAMWWTSAKGLAESEVEVQGFSACITKVGSWINVQTKWVAHHFDTVFCQLSHYCPVRIASRCTAADDYLQSTLRMFVSSSRSPAQLIQYRQYFAVKFSRFVKETSGWHCPSSESKQNICNKLISLLSLTSCLLLLTVRPVIYVKVKTYDPRSTLEVKFFTHKSLMLWLFISTTTAPHKPWVILSGSA